VTEAGGAEHWPRPAMTAVDACMRPLEVSLRVLLVDRYLNRLQGSPRAAATAPRRLRRPVIIAADASGSLRFRHDPFARDLVSDPS
jgi:hypothetical protein